MSKSNRPLIRSKVRALYQSIFTRQPTFQVMTCLNNLFGFALQTPFLLNYSSNAENAQVQGVSSTLLFMDEARLREFFHLSNGRESSRFTEDFIERVTAVLGVPLISRLESCETLEVTWSVELAPVSKFTLRQLHLTYRCSKSEDQTPLRMFVQAVGEKAPTPVKKVPVPKEPPPLPFPRDIPDLSFTASRFREIYRWAMKKPHCLSARNMLLLNDLIWVDGGLQKLKADLDTIEVTSDMVGKTLKRVRDDLAPSALSTEDKIQVISIYRKWVGDVLVKQARKATEAVNRHRSAVRETSAIVDKANAFLATATSKGAILRQRMTEAESLCHTQIQALDAATNKLCPDTKSAKRKKETS